MNPVSILFPKSVGDPDPIRISIAAIVDFRSAIQQKGYQFHGSTPQLAGGT